MFVRQFSFLPRTPSTVLLAAALFGTALVLSCSNDNKSSSSGSEAIQPGPAAQGSTAGAARSQIQRAGRRGWPVQVSVRAGRRNRQAAGVVPRVAPPALAVGWPSGAEPGNRTLGLGHRPGIYKSTR